MKREQSGGKGSYGQKEQMPHALQAHTDRHTQTALDKAAAAAAAASPKPAQPPSLCNRVGLCLSLPFSALLSHTGSSHPTPQEDRITREQEEK